MGNYRLSSVGIEMNWKCQIRHTAALILSSVCEKFISEYLHCIICMAAGGIFGEALSEICGLFYLKKSAAE
jgi:hypothetical protein